MPIAEVQGLTVTFGAVRALDQVTAVIPEGAVGLLGPNGAGKSTLIKTLLGFLQPVSGTAQVLGYDALAHPLEVRARIGYMPESDAFFPGLNAVRMVTLAGELGGLGRTQAVSRSHEVLSYVGLGEARYRDVAGYSTGMRGRVRLAQALVADPDLLLLDEPTNGLDPAGRAEMLALITDIRKRLGIHILLSSHLLPDVEEVCGHVLLVDQGRVVLQGDIKDLKELKDRLYEVEVKGDADAFARALAAEGVTVESKDSNLRMLIRLAEEAGTEPVLRAAVTSGTELRHMVRRERTLGQVFVEAVSRNPAARGTAGKPAEVA